MSDIICETIYRLVSWFLLDIAIPTMPPTIYSEEYDHEYLHYRDRVNNYFIYFDEYFKGYDTHLTAAFRKKLEDRIDNEFERVIASAAAVALEHMKGDIAAIKKQMIQCILSYRHFYTNISIDAAKIGHMWDDLSELKNRALLAPAFTKYIHRACLLASDELDLVCKHLGEQVESVCRHNRDLGLKIYAIIKICLDTGNNSATDSILAEKIMTLHAINDRVECVAGEESMMKKLRQATNIGLECATGGGKN
jgi:hypothetical protein